MNSLFNQNQLVYSMDTSALFAAFNERYPIENFPAFWLNIEELIKNDRLKMSELAFEEAMKDSKVKQWCDQKGLKSYLQSEIDEAVQNKVRKILSQFPKLLDTRKGKSGADPWVIALAMIIQNCTVVTEEGTDGTEKRPKIPNVCAHFGVECIQVVELIKRENWIF